MNLQITAWMFILVLVAGCSSSNKIDKRYTADDKTVFDLMDRLKKNANDAEAAKLLPDAYLQAAETRKNINKDTYNNMNEGDRWIEIAKQLEVAEKMYTEISSSPVLSKIIPDPWNPGEKIRDAKLKAAAEYYNQGLAFLNYNNRPYAQKAYDMFVKANNAYPNYKEVRSLLEQAKELATIKVVVRPVNYYNFGWNYWGFDRDYLQYKMVQDLNSSSSYQHVRFYTDRDADARRIRADRIVELNFNDLYISPVYRDEYTIPRSKKIQTGQTKSNPPQPIYETVYATVYVTRQVLQSRASLECRIYDWATGRNYLSDRFPDNYTWREERARYSGDSRALEPSDWALINNNSGFNAPVRNQVAERLINNCYNQLLSRIRSGVTFGD
ncbi:MAG: hypothetical protein WBO38_10595 [Chitinophagaceae bacterium]